MEIKEKLTREALEQALKTFPGAQDVWVKGSRKLLAGLIVPEWDSTDEYDRQLSVLNYLIQRFGDEATDGRIEFIFTDAPNDDTRDEDAN